jgi:hypothetical protein
VSLRVVEDVNDLLDPVRPAFGKRRLTADVSFR